MLASLSVVACALYVVPLVALIAVLGAASDDAVDLACTMGVVFCGDLLGTLLLTRFFRVDVAAFVRVGLLAAFVAGIAARRTRRGEPVLPVRTGLTRDDLRALAFGAVVAFGLSLCASSQYWIWDREWHVPFTASLRGQQMPFHNVYDPHTPLRYHLAGDAFAAVLQSLSFATMSASRALSVAHDLQAAFAGGMVALLIRAACGWAPLTAGLAAVVPLLAGPLTIHDSQVAGLGPFEGDADFNNFTLSFRPHCMVAAVALMAFMIHVYRLDRDRRRGRVADWSRPLLLTVLMALCAITDEISSVLVGLALAGLWLPWPKLLGRGRWQGALVLVGLVAAALLSNLILGGTIGPGGPIEQTSWVAPRLPRLAAPGLPLGLDPEAWRIFISDEGSLIVPALVIAGLLLANRAVHADEAPPLVFASLIGAAGLVLFLCFEANGRTFEGHRFVTAGRFLVPVAALLCAAKVPRVSLESFALLLPVMAGVVATLGFVFFRLPDKGYGAVDGTYEANCREDFGAQLGEDAAPAYVDVPIWYLYAGCHPIFAPGHDGPSGVVLAGFPMQGQPGFAKMDRELFPAGAAVRVVCGTDPKLDTSVCQRAKAAAACAPEGARAVVCTVPAARRRALAQP